MAPMTQVDELYALARKVLLDALPHSDRNLQESS
jgi:hypothetical protein